MPKKKKNAGKVRKPGSQKRPKKGKTKKPNLAAEYMGRKKS